MKGTGFMALAAVFLLFPAVTEAQQSGETGETGRDALYAQEEFWLGVQSYNRYAYNEAILSFEKALSYRPGDPLYLDWLGRAYYRSGLEDTALRQWQAAAGVYGEGAPETLLLSNRIETVQNRRSLLPYSDGDIRYVEAGRYPGRYDNTVAFRQPSAVLALEDGSAWVVAYGTNEILQIDVNGLIRRRHRGPLNGFDRPYDIVRGRDGNLYVSEYRGGRISVLNGDGDWQYYIGSKGIGPGELVGPQNIAVDEEGYLYVVEYGNRRVSKFDPEGTFIVSFGQREEGFRGLLSPTGIAAGRGRIFVADGVSRQIYAFDRNGRYLDVLASGDLRGPESLRFFPDGRLLAADANRLLLIDVDSAIVSEIGLAGNAQTRIIGAEPDSNGNILAAGFNADEILVMTPIDDMASGLFVQIVRVAADDFPLVTVELQVQDRNRRPIVGLDARNFLISENGQASAEQNFLYAGYRSSDADIAVLVERSPASSLLREDLAAAVRDIDASPGRIRSLVSAGEQPFRESLGTGASSGFNAAALAQAGRGGASTYTPRWRFDLGLRLAATDLLSGAKKRAVVFVSTGRLGELAFEQYSLSELAAYMANNGIIFHAVLVGENPADADIRYLCDRTGGRVLPLYRPEGIGPVLEQLTHTPSGSYILNYRSRLSAAYGRAYLPVEAEVYLLERSGRDGIGYFPPGE
ncbi:MAG: 6-bladed beta-propeller [Treponema sp.]|jgi:DNA-binding beta-propeller fold protein YncE|nr:6-bladed beta-propeller [Treponema sp.]